jgi:hypothetical protein
LVLVPELVVELVVEPLPEPPPHLTEHRRVADASFGDGFLVSYQAL